MWEAQKVKILVWSGKWAGKNGKTYSLLFSNYFVIPGNIPFIEFFCRSVFYINLYKTNNIPQFHLIVCLLEYLTDVQASPYPIKFVIIAFTMSSLPLPCHHCHCHLCHHCHCLSRSCHPLNIFAAARPPSHTLASTKTRWSHNWGPIWCWSWSWGWWWWWLGSLWWWPPGPARI